MTKLRKKSFTVVEQACHEIRGFRKLLEDLDDKVRLSGHSMSTLKSYSRKLVQLSLHFGKLPQHISDKEVNKYLAELARRSKTPSLSDFKLTVLSLRYCYHLPGITGKVAGVVCQTQVAQGNPASAAGLADYRPEATRNQSQKPRCCTKT